MRKLLGGYHLWVHRHFIFAMVLLIQVSWKEKKEVYTSTTAREILSLRTLFYHKFVLRIMQKSEQLCTTVHNRKLKHTWRNKWNMCKFQLLVKEFCPINTDTLPLDRIIGWINSQIDKNMLEWIGWHKHACNQLVVFAKWLNN